MKSAEAHQHLVRMVLVEGRDVASASRSLGLSTRSASRYLCYFRETGGELHYAPEQWNRHRDNIENNAWLRAAVLTAVEEQPELFLEEMADAVNNLAAEAGPGVEVSALSVSRILSRNGFTRKVLEKAYFTRDEASRALWVEAQWSIPLRCRVWLRRWSSPAQFNAWPMLTIDTIFSHITRGMCRGFVRAAVRRHQLYVP
ncbi:hypothetical protein I4F81_002710 [Pyropia yezoensis]|uniref:Uncharacterized protein n=1 Tax=Pyropia yezoensis TaxID=2788 RepID=A0ACC3BRR6_PYRYE|nr:hypothetical protein I4F81_002710 [Neopyropia yezoensis]